jgi:hypothetical protein
MVSRIAGGALTEPCARNGDDGSPSSGAPGEPARLAPTRPASRSVPVRATRRRAHLDA